MSKKVDTICRSGKVTTFAEGVQRGHSLSSLFRLPVLTG
jgi:hypothetical protein